MQANSILKNRGLLIAVAVSVLIHAVALSVKFVVPAASSFKPVSPAIEVVLGGGGYGSGHGTGMGDGNVDDGASVSDARSATETQTEHQVPQGALEKGKLPKSRPITSLSRQNNQNNIPLQEKPEEIPEKNGSPVEKGNSYAGSGIGGGRGDGDSVVFNRNARGGYSLGNAGVQPITAQSRNAGDVLYFKTVQKKVEDIGVINFPQKNGSRLYGQLTVRINVYHDGSLYEKAGGVSIVRSSGNPALDAAALDIVRRAAPFGRFRGTARTIVTRLNFTHDQGIRTQVVSTSS